MNWKFTDATNTVVYRENEDGTTESHLVSVIQHEINAGAIIDPCDLPNPNEEILTKIAALEITTGMTADARKGALESNKNIADQLSQQMKAAGVDIPATKILAQNTAYQTVLAIDNQIKDLESQLS